MHWKYDVNADKPIAKMKDVTLVTVVGTTQAVNWKIYIYAYAIILYLFTVSQIYTCLKHTLNLSWYSHFYVWFKFMNVYICVLYICMYFTL